MSTTHHYVGTVNRLISITQLENVAKICQFQFLDPPPQKHTLVNISWNLALSVLQFWGV